MLRNMFWNQQEHRVRFAWRIIGVSIAALVLSAILTVIFAPESVGGAAALRAPGVFLRVSLATLIGYGVAVWLGGRLLDRRPFADFGLRLSDAWWRDLGFGLALGAVLITAIFLAELAAGWTSVSDTFVVYRGRSVVGSLLLALGGFICIGIYEELAFRGYYLTNVAEWLNGIGPISAPWAIVIANVLTSAVFGLLHATNPNATAVSTANIVIGSIVNLSLGYLLTGRLAIPIGLHITWNLFLGSVFGYAVSGLNIGATLIATETHGPAWLTGGEFGPEAGLLGLLASLVGGLLIAAWVRWQQGKVALARAIAQPPGAQEVV